MHIFVLARLALLGVLMVVSGILVSRASANTSSLWINDNLSLQNEGELQSATLIPPSINSNRDCLNHKFFTRPLKPFQSELSHTTCAVQTSYGFVDPNGWLEFNSTGIAGKLINYAGYSPGSIPVPNSKLLINYFSTGVGAQLYFNQNSPPAIVASTATNGEVTYKINSPAQTSLRDKTNTLLLTQLDTISFSGNGKWMVVDAKNRAVLRVNLDTFEVLPFAPSFNYNIGLDPSAKIAITSDGKFAIVYSKNFSTFKIYDLGTCASVPNSINSPVTCQSKNLLPIAQQQIPGLQTISRIRFIDNESIVFYANYHSIPGIPATNKIAKFRLSASQVDNTNIELLALGDSYISGEGIFEYMSGTDVADNRCHLSLLSHPFIVAERSNMNSYQSVACSGATVPHLLDRDISKVGATKPQAKGKDDPNFSDEIFSNFLPGYRAQSMFVEKHRPDNILISVGGNDIGFSNILKRCLSIDTCYSTYEDRLELVREINSILPELAQTYGKIKQEAPPNAKIYAVGYPQIAKPGGNCALNVHLNSEELGFSQLIIEYLNKIIELSAGNAGVGYVDTQKALNGHKLCETDSSKVAVNGLTAGNDTPSFLNGPIGNESYHPNKLGHQKLADAVLGETQNFNKEMPTALAANSQPPETGLEVLDIPAINRPINRTIFNDSLLPDMFYRELSTNIDLDGLLHSLKPSSLFNLVINSDPVNLGTFTSNAFGNLNAQIKIPESVPAGFHTLHVYGQNIAEEQINIYKTVYLAANELDYDDDGLTNSMDSCPTFDNSGMDTDKDGVDDVCDGIIGLPLAEAEPTNTEHAPQITNNSISANNDGGSSNNLSQTLRLQPASSRINNSSSRDMPIENIAISREDEVGEVLAIATDKSPQISSGGQSSELTLPVLGNNQPKITFALLTMLLSVGLVYLRRLVSEQF